MDAEDIRRGEAEIEFEVFSFIGGESRVVIEVMCGGIGSPLERR
jgi:hypothetical protein